MEHTPTTEQAECANCDESILNVVARDYKMATDEEDVFISRKLRCDTCREESTVTVTPAGVETDGPVSFENASWNESEDESDDE